MVYGPARMWPELTLSTWQDTRETFHMWTQIVGKIRMALKPFVNHWWEVPPYLAANGLSTAGAERLELGLLVGRDHVVVGAERDAVIGAPMDVEDPRDLGGPVSVAG